ncbi:MAG: nucleotide exchange factor GrpE [Candidatus Jorgensenbacteria bacterium]|nr:nucleotide exchange factor GrpE [Candidatus Jorgensenbacteria bacterium]
MEETFKPNNEKKVPRTVEELVLALAECEKTRDEYLDGWKRAKADFANYQKDEAARAAALAKFANEVVLADLLHVLDSFDLGLATVDEKDPARKGMELIRGQLEEVMRRHGVARISVKPGDVFDPARHEAVGEIESGIPPSAVAEEVGAGYLLHGKMVRPARVKLSKHAP